MTRSAEGQGTPKISDETPLRLQEAVKIAFPLGNMTVSGLRREIEKGRLPASLIAGRYFVTLADIRVMFERCKVQPKPEATTRGSRPEPLPSREEMISRARAACEARLQKLNAASSPRRSPPKRERNGKTQS